MWKIFTEKILRCDTVNFTIRLYLFVLHGWCQYLLRLPTDGFLEDSELESSSRPLACETGSATAELWWKNTECNILLNFLTLISRIKYTADGSVFGIFVLQIMNAIKHLAHMFWAHRDLYYRNFATFCRNASIGYTNETAISLDLMLSYERGVRVGLCRDWKFTADLDLVTEFRTVLRRHATLNRHHIV